jgi:hypothetical protein
LEKKTGAGGLIRIHDDAVERPSYEVFKGVVGIRVMFYLDVQVAQQATQNGHRLVIVAEEKTPHASRIETPRSRRKVTFVSDGIVPGKEGARK